MFKKVHRRLTLLCTGITTIIMIVMSLGYLYVSEQNLYKNQFNSFKNDMTTISTNLERQSVISMEWLAKMEAQGNYSFFLLDNGVPFLYNKLNNLGDSSQKDTLLQECLDEYNQTFKISVVSDEKISFSYYTSYQIEFEFSSPSTGEDYFCSVINLERNSSTLQVIVLSSLDALHRQILEQRMLFVFIDLITMIVLGVFSFAFTGKLLKPIEENQQKQIQFVAAASHELRTPLAVILSSAECCRDAEQEKQASFLNTIHNEGLRMRTLINDMLTLSSSDSHNFSIEKKETELDTLLMNSYEAFEPLAKEHKLSLSIQLPKESLPSCNCDKDRISQVISILLHNAISYTKEGGKIELSLSFQKEHFYLSVSDNGIGISDEDKKKIFGRFYRAEKARSTKGHFGLGLSIAYEIVKSHHGNLSVKDATGGGSIFTIELPRK